MIDTHNSDDLKKIVDEVFELDLLRKTRQREYVDARRVFSHLLLKEGATLSGVGSYLGLNHATVHYYTKKFEWIIKSDLILREKYELILTRYKPTPATPDVYFFSNKQLIEEVLRLREDINVLNSQKACQCKN
jgi:hypothetical protein|tara:strand:+ start:292 stop:690 length:399 start_codon:yes stop_codon:yes gene_type:complete